MNITLKTISLDVTPTLSAQPGLSASEYEARANAVYDSAHADWVVVYGDREHTANLTFVCGFDPRFEEAVLVLGPARKRVLVVGNEGLGYTSTSLLPVDVMLCQTLSLMGQPRGTAPHFGDILRRIGLSAGASVAVVGWKYMEPAECEDPDAPSFVPAFLVSALQRVVGPSSPLRDATALLMHPVSGLKSRNSAAQIATFEWAAARASAGVHRVVRGAQPGMTEYEAAGLIAYEGDPLTCHTMMASAGPDAQVIGLSSPSSRKLGWGDGVTTAYGLRGGLCARAGLLRDTPDPVFLERYVTPYYRAVATWWGTMRAGLTGGAVNDAVMGVLSGAVFQPALNPGHLGSIDEWTHSPIRPGSTEQIGSGMVFQCDIIPSPMPNGQTLNCEDTMALADASLRAEIRAGYPELWARIEQRRAFMRQALGIALAEDVLPLSVAPGYLQPFWMARDLVCAVA